MSTNRRVFPLAAVKPLIGRAFAVCTDAEQRAEGVERIEAAVKAEGKFIQVGLKVLRADTVMRVVNHSLVLLGIRRMNWMANIVTADGAFINILADRGSGHVAMIASLGNDQGVAGGVIGFSNVAHDDLVVGRGLLAKRRAKVTNHVFNVLDVHDFPFFQVFVHKGYGVSGYSTLERRGQQ